MSENPDQWEEMLRAVLGNEAADRMIEQMRSQGIDPGAQMSEMMNPANFNQIVNQVRAMIGSSGDGPVNWKVGEQVARETIQRDHLDTLTAAEGERARTCLQTANLWLDPATEINPCMGPNQAWSRLDWLAHTLATFKRLTEPVGENVARAFTDVIREQMEYAPEEIRSLFGGDSSQMMEGILSSLLGMQYGAGLAELATISFGTADAGLPLVEGETAALVPANVAEFAEDLEAEPDEVILFAAVREQAAARLYSRISWLRPQLLDTVAAYAREIQIDTDSIEEQVREMGGFNPAAMQELNLTAVFAPSLTPNQETTLARLEHLLSLAEGWISAVSAQAVIAQLPHAVALGEMFQRRSATSSPVNQIFGRSWAWNSSRARSAKLPLSGAWLSNGSAWRGATISGPTPTFCRPPNSWKSPKHSSRRTLHRTSRPSWMPSWRNCSVAAAAKLPTNPPSAKSMGVVRDQGQVRAIPVSVSLVPTTTARPAHNRRSRPRLLPGVRRLETIA